MLGDLNYLFLNHEYIYRLKTRNDNYYNYNFKICSTSFTNDSDRQENTIFYSSVMSCAIRYFTGLFCDSPSYCAIGYELKDFCKKEKEYFSSIYTNYQENAFKWGDNAELFAKISETIMNTVPSCKHGTVCCKTVIILSDFVQVCQLFAILIIVFFSTVGFPSGESTADRCCLDICKIYRR